MIKYPGFSVDRFKLYNVVHGTLGAPGYRLSQCLYSVLRDSRTFMIPGSADLTKNINVCYRATAVAEY